VDRGQQTEQSQQEVPIENQGRVLGLDVGDRRIGVAVSDELGLTAQPVLTLVRKNRRQDLGSLARLVRKYGCAQVVVGNPLYMSGDVSPQALKAQALAQALQLQTGARLRSGTNGSRPPRRIVTWTPPAACREIAVRSSIR
jgi:RNase H-fold protein (predicted Holliday junction resolvase)